MEKKSPFVICYSLCESIGPAAAAQYNTPHTSGGECYLFPGAALSCSRGAQQPDTMVGNCDISSIALAQSMVLATTTWDIFYLVENEAQNFAPQTFPTILVWFLRQYSFDFRAYVHCLNRALYALCTRLFILIADWVAHFAIVYSCPTICCVCASLLHV